MTRTLLNLALAGFAACAFSTPVLADPPQPKIAVLNRSDILRFSKVGQDIQRQMQAAANQAKAGVGATPRSTTSAPSADKPTHNACTSAGPDSRVSRAT